MAIINSIIEKLTYYEDQDWDLNQDQYQVNNDNDKDKNPTKQSKYKKRVYLKIHCRGYTNSLDQC